MVIVYVAKDYAGYAAGTRPCLFLTDEEYTEIIQANERGVVLIERQTRLRPRSHPAPEREER